MPINCLTRVYQAESGQPTAVGLGACLFAVPNMTGL